MAGNTVELKDDSFDVDVLQSDVPVLVDFWAAWCAPCRAMAPVIDEIADEFAGKLKVGKLPNQVLSKTVGFLSQINNFIFVNLNSFFNGFSCLS